MGVPDKKRERTQEFVCKDNYAREVLIGCLVFGCLICVSAIIGVAIGLVFNDISVVDSIMVLLGSETCGIVLIALCSYSLCTSKTTLFTINNETIKLIGKKHREDVNIERRIEDIQCIVVKLFRKVRSIVLVDNIGEIGYWAASQNGEFIKIQYSKKRLNEIKRFLPNCPVIFSDNTEFGEL